MVSAAEMRHTYPGIHDREGTIEDAVAALSQAYDEGLRTIIDLTTFDLGRDIQMLEEVSRRTGVNIILTANRSRLGRSCVTSLDLWRDYQCPNRLVSHHVRRLWPGSIWKRL